MSSVIVTLKSTTPTLAEIIDSAKAAGLGTHIVDPVTVDVFSLNEAEINKWVNENKNNVNLELDISPIKMAPRQRKASRSLRPAAFKPNSTGVPYFWMNQIAAIYAVPNPNPSTNVVVGVVSFGGGLYGSVDADGVLTNSDCSNYWTAIGISPPNHPRVIIKPLFGAVNSPNANDGGSTLENTLDVQTIGGACPSPNLTIILYISPNSLAQFPNLLSYIYTTPVVVNSVSYKPTIVSVSWGAPEIYYGGLITSINNQLATMTAAGMNILVATGDNGSNDGVGGGANYVDYPSSSPYATAVGGTSLTCPNNVYDSFTSETAWSSGGGGISALNSKPTYQSAITSSGRATPDVAAVGDPNTGVVYLVNGQYELVGGTSVAAPIIASFLAAINYNSFVNPKLYAAAVNCYHDVTTGSNGGFSAHSGYDNCTGWGTINGYNLSRALNLIIATSITLSPTSLSVPIGQTATLTPTILPVNVSSSTVSWTSGNTVVAIVNNGVVTGVAVGSTTISVATTDGSNLTTSVPITVTNPTANVPVTGVILNQSVVTLHPTNTTQLVATVAPANATTQTVSWSSSNPSVATVNQSGLVTAVVKGLAIITATTTDGAKKATATINVTTPVASVSVNPTSLSLTVGQAKQLTASVLPTNAGDRTVTWTSLNPSVATVTSTGYVLGVGNGSATIRATTNDMGFQATAIVSVFTKVQSVAISPSSTVNLSIGQTQELTAVITPATATNKSVTWTSSNQRIATVNSTGVVSAIGNGSCYVTVTSQDGNKQSSVLVQVVTHVTGVSLNLSSVSISRGATRTLLATVTPTNASNANITWSTNNGNIATVSSRGTVSAVRSGQATITVRTADGNFTATCLVTVV